VGDIHHRWGLKKLLQVGDVALVRATCVAAYRHIPAPQWQECLCAVRKSSRAARKALTYVAVAEEASIQAQLAADKAEREFLKARLKELKSASH